MKVIMKEIKTLENKNKNDTGKGKFSYFVDV